MYIFWPLNTEKLKMFGSVNKKFLCYIREICLLLKESVFLEVMKCTQTFASLKNGNFLLLIVTKINVSKD